MRLFTDLYTALDQTNKTNEKVAALADYFSDASAEDAAWAFYFLSGRKPRQIIPSAKLRAWAIEAAGIPEWLYAESRDTVGDSSETIDLLLPNQHVIDETPLHTLVEDQLLPLRTSDEETQKAAVTEAWARMNYAQRLVYNKLISGSFRVGVSQHAVADDDQRAVAIAGRLVGEHLQLAATGVDLDPPVARGNRIDG